MKKLKRVLFTACLLIAFQTWADICAQTGVFVCDTFEDPEAIAGIIYAGTATPGANATTAVVDNGMLTFTIPTLSGPNGAGEYRLPTFGPITEGDELYLAYRIRADQGAKDMPAPGRKHFVLWRGSSSCTDLELSLTHRYGYGNPIWSPYTQCGSPLFDKSLPGGNVLLQYPDAELTYWQITGGGGTPIGYSHAAGQTKVDVWQDVYIEIEVGTFGGYDSTFVFWVHDQPDGTWRRFIDVDDFRVMGDVGYGNFAVTPFMTGKQNTTDHTPGIVDYDYVVMSTEPLDKDLLADEPLPDEEPPPEPPPITHTRRVQLCIESACSWVYRTFEGEIPEPPEYEEPPAEGDAPAWVADMTVGEWEEISLNTIADVDPNDDPEVNPNYPSVGPWLGNGHPCVITCWNGGAYASEFGAYGSLVQFGGGHNGYAGSEIYTFDLATRTWTRLTDPYYPTTEIDAETGTYTDGSPLPPHTYAGVSYSPATNEFAVLRGIDDNAESTLTANVKTVNLFDFDTLTWRNAGAYTGGVMHGGSSLWDYERNQYFMVPPDFGQLIVFDPSDDSYDYYTNAGFNIDTNAAMDPRHDHYFVTNFRTCGGSCIIYIYDALNLAAARTTVIQNGTTPAYWGGSGWEWSDNLDGFVYHSEQVGHVYLLTKDVPETRSDRNWTWSQLSDAETPIPTKTSNDSGTYNRFQVVDFGAMTVAFVVNSITGPVYGMRLQ